MLFSSDRRLYGVPTFPLIPVAAASRRLGRQMQPIHSSSAVGSRPGNPLGCDADRCRVQRWAHLGLVGTPLRRGRVHRQVSRVIPPRPGSNPHIRCPERRPCRLSIKVLDQGRPEAPREQPPLDTRVQRRIPGLHRAGALDPFINPQTIGFSPRWRIDDSESCGLARGTSVRTTLGSADYESRRCEIHVE